MTIQITVKGMVQGIGYRPFIAKMAEKYGISGYVRNTDGIVHIKATAESDVLDRFVDAISNDAPVGTVVTSMDVKVVDDFGEDANKVFVIKSSEKRSKSEIFMLPTDIGICDSCLGELFDKNNRRYRHPFISCVSCGPRYSILKTVPYDRESITMSEFKMCSECEREYTSQGDIRRHAQTIACNKCGPILKFTDNSEKKIQFIADSYNAKDMVCKSEQISSDSNDCMEANDRYGNEQAIEKTIQYLKKGAVVAIKDIGGYHLACSPFNSDSVEKLRDLKGRKSKPFALMFDDIDSIKKICKVNDEEEKQLLSDAKPIVLLDIKDEYRRYFAENVCHNSPYIGAMLPSNAVQALIMKEMKTLIMTSANASGDIMIIDNEEMHKWPVAVLSNDRDILTPLDDSIVRIVANRRIVVRRARGFVPMPVKCNIEGQVFAAGSDLKATFCYVRNNMAYLSQSFGDLVEEESYNWYKDEIVRVKKLFHFVDEVAVCDMHPAFVSGKLIEKMRDENGDKLKNNEIIKIQHHYAHIASVIAEHDIKNKAIGIAFDGTGFGLDSNIWGSEFFICNEGSFERIGHLKEVSLAGSDIGAKDASIILYGFIASLSDEVRKLFLDKIGQIDYLDIKKMELTIKAVDFNINRVKSTSMGRLFDAVSALLGVCLYNSYEGEAPIEMEYLAATTNDFYPLSIDIEKTQDGYVGNVTQLFADILGALIENKDKAMIARGFIYAVADFMVNMCCKLADDGVFEEKKSVGISEGNINKEYKSDKTVILGGGTFLNKILLKKTICDLEAKGFKVYINEQVPPSDAGICFGQAYLSDKNINGGLVCV